MSIISRMLKYKNVFQTNMYHSCNEPEKMTVSIFIGMKIRLIVITLIFQSTN